MPDIQIRLDHLQGRYASQVLRKRSEEFLRALRLPDASLSILVTTDEGIHELNLQFLGVDRPTDVLSFPAGDPLPGLPGLPGEEEGNLGDLAISLDTARRRAKEDGRTLAAELARYLAHGLLHLLGYDHERSEEDAREMAAKEAALLGEEGMLEGNR